MSAYDLIQCDSPESLAGVAADDWLHSMRSIHQTAGVAFSGGRIARNFLSASAQLSQKQGLSLDGVHFFWADERCVPPNDDESNFKLAQDNFLAPLQIVPENVHRIHGEIDPVEAAARSEQELRRWHQLVGLDQEVPVLDLIFLGMGEDGHVASLFPDGPKPGDRTELFIPVKASKPPPQRITINYQLIRSAREVIVLASGTGKEHALKTSLNAESDTPLARVLEMRLKTRIYTDLLL